eukprot:Clim_evm102s152 gene=Clim_evmTU102s152
MAPSSLAAVAGVILGLPVALTALKTGMMVLAQNKLIYAGYLPPGSRSSVNFHGIERTTMRADPFIVETTDGKAKLQCYLMHDPARLESIASSVGRAPLRYHCLLYFHGNAGNIGHRMEHLWGILQSWPRNDPLTDRPIYPVIFGVDYRGYGLSSGTATEIGLRNDAVSVLETTQKRFRTVLKAIGSADSSTVESNDIRLFIYGHSLGGAVGLHCAATAHRLQQSCRDTRSAVDGLIVENTFTSVPEVARAFYPRWSIPHRLSHSRWLLWNRWDCRTSISDIDLSRLPVLLLSSSNDDVLPPSMMEELRALLVEKETANFDDGGDEQNKNCGGRSKIVFQGIKGGHHDDGFLKPYYWDAWKMFLKHSIGDKNT